MGTDISLFVERWTGSRWECQVPVRDLERWPRAAPASATSHHWGPHGCILEYKCNECDGSGSSSGRRQQAPGCEHCLGTGQDLRWYRHRNYALFELLQGRGEIGKTIPGRTERPSDASLPVARWQDCNRWSWVMLDEVSSFYDWDTSVADSATISLMPGPATGPRADWPVDDFAAWVARGRGRPEGGYRHDGHILTVPEAERWLAGDFQLAHEPSCIAEQERHVAGRASKLPGGGAGRFRCREHNVRVEWVEPAREVCADFLAFLRELVMPMLPAEYQQIRSVLDDALEDKRPSQEVIDELTLQAWEYEETIRLVYGFG